MRAWPDLAIEALLRLGGSFQPIGQSSWPLPPRLHERVVVRWPRTYQWHHTGRWGDQLADLLRRRVDVTIADLSQAYQGTVLSEFQIDGQAYNVAFNISDYPDFVDERCTRESLVTFKFQFRQGGYADRRIVPGGYLPGSPILYQMLRYLRWLKDHCQPRFDVYGRFTMDLSPGVRGEALRRLAHARTFQFYGGDRLVRYSRYLREVARSRLCVDLPGRGPLCFRLVEYLAVGSCIIAQPHGVTLLGPLTDGVHIAYSPDGPSQMVQRCRVLLDDAAQQRAMVIAARAFFDRHLHRDQLSAYYLHTVLAAAGAV
jgi:hypothetical protein